MGKRFRGKTCVYCGQSGSTADHVFARQFFPKDRRANLPQVCACAPCNAEKSQLEHYALSILPFGGQHPDSAAILQTEVPGRLAKNRKLHRELAEGRRDVSVAEGGEVRDGMTIPLDPEKLFALFALIARALVAFHWSRIVPPDYIVEASALSRQGERMFENLMVRAAASGVQAQVASGLLLYEGAQLGADPCRTLWRFQIYGGVILGVGDRPDEAPSNIWARTGPQADGRPWA